ncbi:MAG: 3-beta hydroxysteroid dehydrogenase [Frankiales bacterium]|nr:3-beta hydroxysteroid dehydrogenase [Frankiales bacterium]
MRVFVTGASGWIGSAVVDELLAAGHDVIGLVRSDSSATVVQAKGATLLRGDLDDLDALRRGAAEADATVHLANKHDWSNPAESNRAERVAVETIAGALVGTDRSFVVASGVLAAETEPSPFVGPDSMRGGSENRAFDFIDQGVRAIAARFAPTVHGMRDHGFIAYITDVARRTGVSAYVGDGSNAWAAVHRSDAARLVRLGLEKAPAGARLHAVAEDAVRTRVIAEAIGTRLGLPVTSIAPEEADDHFGFIGQFFGRNMSSSSVLTRTTYGWDPTGPTLVEDILAGAYDAS